MPLRDSTTGQADPIPLRRPAGKAPCYANAMKNLVLSAAALLAANSASGAIQFRHQEIETELGIGYAVLCEDVDGDGDADIVALNETQVIWWSNPDWTKRVILDGETEEDNVSIAAHDITGDGKLDFAIGAAWRPSDTEGGGTLQWISRQSDESAEWAVHPLGNEPTTHRMRWADTNGDGRSELIVAPLHGRGTSGPRHWIGNGIRLLALTPPAEPTGASWAEEVIDDTFHIAHNFWVLNFDSDPADELLVASYEGVHLLDRGAAGGWERIRLGEGFQGDSIRGAGEVKLGTLASGKRYIATVEPWHANHIVIYSEPAEPRAPWQRSEVVNRLNGGHALWTGDLDGDGDQELAFGWRLKGSMPYDRPGVAIYDPRTGDIQIVDWGGMATEDLTMADLNADGRPEIVAAGRGTHNLKIYWNEGPKPDIE